MKIDLDERFLGATIAQFDLMMACLREGDIKRAMIHADPIDQFFVGIQEKMEAENPTELDFDA